MSYVTQNDLEATVKFVMGKIHSIEAGMRDNRPSVTKELAVLRHGLGEAAGSYPAAWQAAFDGCPESLLGSGETPSAPESAIYAVLTIFSMHAQGSSMPVHTNKISFGNAMRLLTLKSSDGSIGNASMPASMAALITADSISEMEHYLRQCVARLRAQGLGINYAKLTNQVLRFHDEGRRDGVRLEWSREFSRLPETEDGGDGRQQE